MKRIRFVVIAAMSIQLVRSPETILRCEDIENLLKARRNRPLLLIDLSVPRNIDPAVTGLDHVSLYNIDDLEAVARRGVQAREQELTACHQIVEAHVAALTEKLLTEEAKALGDRPDSFQPAFLFHNQRSRNQRWHDVMFQVEI